MKVAPWSRRLRSVCYPHGEMAVDVSAADRVQAPAVSRVSCKH